VTSKKEMLFLGELEEVLDRVVPPHLAEVQKEVFTQVRWAAND
jgi:hypothetical protein